MYLRRNRCPHVGHDCFGRINDTTGYTLIRKRLSRVPTFLQHETDTADWSTPTFTLPCPKNGGVYPATATFPQNCTPISEIYPDLAGSWTLPSVIFSARIIFRSHQRTPKHKSSCSKQTMTTGSNLSGRSFRSYQRTPKHHLFLS